MKIWIVFLKHVLKLTSLRISFLPATRCQSRHKFLLPILLIKIAGCQSIWQENGFSESEAAEWQARGITRATIAQVKPWKDAGFTPYEASQWDRNFSAASAKSWREAGFNAQQATAWGVGMQTSEAQEWISAGFSHAEHSIALRWKSQKLAARDAAVWRRSGIPPEEATEWQQLGFKTQGFDLAQFGFKDHATGLKELLAGKILDEMPSDRRAEAAMVAGGLRERSKYNLKTHREWTEHKFSLADALRYSEWTEAGFNPPQLRGWSETGLPVTVAAAYLKENIQPAHAKNWHAAGVLPESASVIKEWAELGLTASDYSKWSALKVPAERISQFVTGNISLEAAKEILRLENNYFAKEHTETILSDGSIVSDKLFPYLVDLLNSVKYRFAMTIPDLEEMIDGAESEYKKTKVAEALRSDKRINARIREFEDFTRGKWICHTSPFETEFDNGAWFVEGSGGGTNVIGINAANNQHEKFRSWSLGNQELLPDYLSIANHPKGQCKPHTIMGIPLSRCRIPIPLAKKHFDGLDNGDLQVYWCMKPPLKMVRLPTPQGYVTNYTDYYVGTELRMVIAEREGGEIILK